MPSQMQASSRAHRYPWQPRELQPPTGNITMRNSGEILTDLYIHQDQPRGRGGALTATQMPIWSSKLHGLPEQVFIIWCMAKTYMLNRGAWSANTTDQHWFNFNLSDDIYLLSQMHETFDLIFSVPKNVLVTSKDFRYFRNINEDVLTTSKHFQMHL